MKRRKMYLLAAICLISFLSGCVSVDYIGNNYPPTYFVQIFFDPAEIPAGYVKMGEATASLADEDELFVGASAVNEELKKKAMSVGADAMLIVSNTRVQTGVKTVNTYSNSYREKNKSKGHVEGFQTWDGQYGAVRGRQKSKTEGYNYGNATQHTYNTTAKVVSAVFYKKVGGAPATTMPVAP